jgi:hypothetical protein
VLAVPRTRTSVLNTPPYVSLKKKDVADEQVHHGDSYGSRGSGLDKTGHLDQDAHKYESTGAGATDSYPDLEHTKSRKGTGGIGGIVSQPSLCTYAH